jgi:basic membrane protein A
MRIRSTGAALFAGVTLIVSACTSSGATAVPSVAAPSVAAPSVAAPSTAPSAAPSAAATPAPSSALKIGVVTDIGSLNDKNFNEYTYKGAVAGAADIGAATPGSVVPKSSTEYAADIKSFTDQHFDVIVTVGFNLTHDTIVAAKANPNTWFIGVDQAPCVTPTGIDDVNFACKGDAKTLLPKYISITYQEDQAGYLAGMVAAGISKSGTIAAIGGTSLCPACIRYIQGYGLGAQSINSAIVVKVAYVTADFSTKAFGDPVYGKQYATSFIAQNKPDVIFQVAGATGNGILDAACSAGINGIGVDVDQYLSYPNADKCIVTSAEKHLTNSVEATIKTIGAGTAVGGPLLFNAANNGIGISDFHDKTSMISADLTAKLATALAAMTAGTLKTCPATGCGVYSK